MAYLNENGLAELWSRIKEEDLKRLRFATGTYTGTGEYGADNPSSLTFDFAPKMVFIMMSASSGGLYASLSRGFAVAMRGVPYMLKVCALNDDDNMAGIDDAENIYNDHVTWTDNGLSWYGTGPTEQMSYQGTYQYVAIG